jgi:hypothetical protein
MNAITFQIGATYTARSASDADTTYEWTIIARTPKFITTRNKWGETKRSGIKISDGIEISYPDGSYAWAPIIHADRPHHTS